MTIRRRKPLAFALPANDPPPPAPPPPPVADEPRDRWGARPDEPVLDSTRARLASPRIRALCEMQLALWALAAELGVDEDALDWLACDLRRLQRAEAAK